MEENQGLNQPIIISLVINITGWECHNLFVLVSRDWVYLCSLGCPGTRHVDHAVLKVTEVHLLLPPMCCLPVS